MKKNMGLIFLAMGLVWSEFLWAASEEPVKVFSGVPAATPPVIDGLLTDACWQTTPVLDDFVPLAGISSDKTAVRVAYDSSNIYLAVECFTRKPQAIRAGTAKIREKPDFSGGFVHVSHFVNRWSIEVFLDPNASLRNAYQLLFNAAGQICGQYKGDWDPFAVKPFCKTQLGNNGWSAEMALPLKGILDGEMKIGDIWGFNVARNDDLPVAIWKQPGGFAWYQPTDFGVLVIGDPAAWWQAAFEEGIVRRMADISERIKFYDKKAPYLAGMCNELQRRIQEARSVVEKENSGRDGNLAAKYTTYSAIYPLFHRLTSLYSTIMLSEKNEPAFK